MKQIYGMVIPAIIAALTAPFGAKATPISHFYTNGIAANNIIVMQRSIMLNTFNNFDGSPSVHLGPSVDARKSHSNKANSFDKEDSSTKYYGTIQVYGEYGDDGTVLYNGHNGGDSYTTIKSNWLNWQHAKDYTKFKNFNKIDSLYDFVSFGIEGGSNSKDDMYSKWGIFGGLVFAHENNPYFDLAEVGQHIGIFSGHRISGFNISAAANVGVLFNTAKQDYGTDRFANLWLGATINTSYDIVLDKTFTLQPGFYIGYTWIQSDDYKSKSGDKITNQDFNAFQLAPTIRALKHIVDDWYGILSVQHTFHIVNGGDTTVNETTTLPELELMDYTEYGLSLEKNVADFNVSASIIWHNGGRTGWAGALQVKYLF